MKEFRFAAYTRRRSHGEDAGIPPGEVRRADRWQEFNCLAPKEAYHRVLTLLEIAAKENRLVSGVLILSDREEGGSP